MAKFRSINEKKKDYIIKYKNNDKEKNPAKVLYKRFPIPHELFYTMKKDIFDGIDVNNKQKDDIQKSLMENLRNNISSTTIDYKTFFEECIERFEDFEYGESKVITVSDYWQILPLQLAYDIAEELHEYANEKDEFAVGE